MAININGSMIIGSGSTGGSGGSGGSSTISYSSSTALAYTLTNPKETSPSFDNFGWSVDIDTTYTVVGAYAAESSSGVGLSGVVYVYNTATGALVHAIQNPSLDGTTPQTTDKFGQSVAVHGNYIVAAAPGEDDGGSTTGVAYVFDAATGSLLHTLHNPNPYGSVSNDQFGLAISAHGNYAIVGSRYSENNGVTSGGMAYVFDMTTGNLVYTLDNPNGYDTPAGDNFGLSVDISATHAIVGAPYEDDINGSGAGKSYVFSLSNGSLLYTFDNPNAYYNTANDLFGLDVAIDGNYAVVGTPYEDNDYGNESGSISIYDLTTGNELFNIPNPDASNVAAQFGLSVDIDGNYAVVGAWNETGGGKIYIYDVTTGSLIHSIANPNTNTSYTADQFGRSVAISAYGIAVGAPYESGASVGDNTGIAYIFK